MEDRAIAIIKSARSVSFKWFRASFKADNNMKDALDYGHVVIDTISKLDQYLYTYGPMIQSQWEQVASYLIQIDPPTTWIDYGCGQGLAGLLVSDITNGRLFSLVREIFLIEPSSLALARSSAIYERISPRATVNSICKRFDEVRDSDVVSARSAHTLHVFSNSLDIPGFNPLKLLAKTLRPGRHTILSVSHNRDFNGGTPRIESVRAAFEASTLAIKRSTIDPFTCDNQRKSEGVIWLCEFEVEDG